MRRRFFLAWWTMALGAAAAGCGPTEDVSGTVEIRKVRADTLDVVVLSSHGRLRRGQETFIVEFRSASDGALVDAGTVRASANIRRTGTGPKFTTVEVRPGDVPGRYLASGEFDMPGTWRLGVEWAGPAGRSSTEVSFPVF